MGFGRDSRGVSSAVLRPRVFSAESPGRTLLTHLESRARRLVHPPGRWRLACHASVSWPIGSVASVGHGLMVLESAHSPRDSTRVFDGGDQEVAVRPCSSTNVRNGRLVMVHITSRSGASP